MITDPQVKGMLFGGLSTLAATALGFFISKYMQKTYKDELLQ